MPGGVQVRPLLPAPPRQKKPTALRFRRGGESSVSVGSFFLSETGVSRGTPVSVTGNGSDLNCPGAPEKGKSEQDFPFSGAAPSAQNDPLRSNAKGDSRPLSRSLHADPKVGSDLDCPGAPRQNNTIRSPAAARRRPVDRWCCFSFPNRRTHGVFHVCMISLLRCCRQVPVIASPAPPWTRLPACRAGSGRHRPAALFR